jgi:hypothetical protein
MITNDDFNSAIGQFKNYTTIVGGMPPKTEIPSGGVYPVNVWSKQVFASATPNNSYSLVGTSPDINIDGVISVSSSATTERKFVFTDKSIFKDCATIIGFTTPDSTLLKSFSIGALLRYDPTTPLTPKFICSGIEGNGTNLYLKIKTFDGTAYTTVGTTIQCDLLPSTQYWIVAIAVGLSVRCELWDSDPVNTKEIRKTAITRTVPSGYNAKGRVGVANWKPQRTSSAGSPGTITSFETGNAFSNTIDGNISTITNNTHVDIRSMINQTKTFPRFLQRLQGYHQSQNAYSQTLKLNTDPVSGTFTILVYNTDNNYLQPLESTPLNWNASSNDIRTALTSLVSQNYQFSRFDGNAILSVTRSTGASCFPFTVEFNHFYGDLSFMRAKVENLLDGTHSVPSAATGYWDPLTKIAMFKPSIEDRIYIQTGDPLNPHSTQDDLRSSDFTYSEDWKLYSAEGGRVMYPMTANDIIIEKVDVSGRKKRAGKVTLPTTGSWSFSMQSSMPSTVINALLPGGLGNSSINLSFFNLDPTALHLYAPTNGLWSAATSYSTGNTVEFGGLLYTSLHNSNLNNNPASSPSYWESHDGGCHIQFTSNNAGLFYDQGGEALDDSARVYLAGKLIPTPADPAIVGNYDFRAVMSDFTNTSTHARFNFGSITGVRIILYGGKTGIIYVTGIRAIKTVSPSNTYNPSSVDIGTRLQNVYAPMPLRDQNIVSLPPMIRGTSLRGAAKDPFNLNGEGQVVVKTSDNITENVNFNKIQLYSRYRYEDSLIEWITTEFGYNKTRSYIKTFKTYRARSLDDSSVEMYWDVHPGGVATVQQSFHPPWSNTTVYVIGDTVEHSGHFYKALQNNGQWDPTHPTISGLKLEPAESLPNSRYWGRIDTISDLKGVQSSSRYIFSSLLESNSAITSVDFYEVSPDRIYEDAKTSKQEWTQKSGRTGWYAELLDDSEIESFTFESAGYAILRTKQLLCDTPVDGAQLYTKDSGYKNVFESFSPKNPDENVVIDWSNAPYSSEGSFRIDPKGQKYYPGFISNQFTINNWAHVFIDFDIWVPSNLTTENLKPKIYLQSADFTVLDEENVPVEYLGPLSFNFTPNVWSSVSKSLRDFERYPTGEYFLIVASDEPHNKSFWTDNVKINQQTIEWEIRAISGGAWFPFRNTVNEMYGAVHLPASQRGTEIQLQARALTEDAWVSEYTLRPHYAELGRLLYADYRTGEVTGKAFIGQSDRKNVNTVGVYSSGTTYALGNVVEYSNTAYVSLVASNLNHTPSSSPSQWVRDQRNLPVDTKGLWLSTRTYSANELIEYGSSVYISLQNSNTNHVPLTATTWWRRISVSQERGNSVEPPKSYLSYNSGAAYGVGNFVQYASGGETYFYICIQSNTGKDPAAYSDYWRIYGDAGVWNSTITYIVGDIVQRTDLHNDFYVSIQEGSNKDPLTQTDYWRKLSAASESSVDAYAIHLSGSASAGDVELSRAPNSLEDYTTTGSTS